MPAPARRRHSRGCAMPLVFLRYFWFLAIGVTFLNAAIFWVRSRRHVAKDPSLAAGYRTLILGLLFWPNLLLVVMGIGCIVGGVPTVFHLFRPRDGNPFVLASFATVFAVIGLGTYWLFRRGGAEMLVRHPGLLEYRGIVSGNLENPVLIKLLWCLMVSVAMIASVSILFTDIPIPNFRR